MLPHGKKAYLNIYHMYSLKVQELARHIVWGIFIGEKKFKNSHTSKKQNLKQRSQKLLMPIFTKFRKNTNILQSVFYFFFFIDQISNKPFKTS